MTQEHLSRRALLIGTSAYADERFAPLASSWADVARLRQVLMHRAIGGFTSADVLNDPTADEMRAAVAGFLSSCDTRTMALVYVSGHGVRLRSGTGEFYFVASDTDFDRVAETGVAAGFVNEQFESSAAPQKVAVLDSCRSGGFAAGFRTRDREPVAKSDTASAPREPAPLTGRGFYVLASSGAVEDSFAGRMTPDGPEPSAFTGRIVDALATGRAGRDTAGTVTVDDLFQVVSQQMRQIGQQRPQKHAIGVDDRIVLAKCPQGPIQLDPVTPPAPRPESEVSPDSPGAKGADWPALLNYYRRCVQMDGARSDLMPAHELGSSFVCVGGAEQFLSGTVDDDDCVAVPPGAEDLVAQAVQQGTELWAGYPTMLLTDRRNGGRSQSMVAPLVIRRVEIVSDHGRVRLKPYGPATPYPGLTRGRLDADAAALLQSTYTPGWHAGQYDRMAVDLKNLLSEEFQLGCVEELRPELLTDRLDVRTPAEGARNIAVLMPAPDGSRMTANLLRDLAVVARSRDIESTALGALSPHPRRKEAGSGFPPYELTTPLPANPAQLDVLHSAMSQRLTVATGPPGTGKSQLVANLVATAIAAGQTVLIASTNNEAVNEVWRRCAALAPGSVIRTGSRSSQYAEQERQALAELSMVGSPDGSPATAAAEAAAARQRLAKVQKSLRRIAELERTLLTAGTGRAEAAADLDRELPDLLARLGDAAQLPRIARQLDRAATARILGEWRRTRLLRRLGLESDGESRHTCTTLARVAHRQIDWSTARSALAEAPDDVAGAAELYDAETAVRTTSQRLLELRVRTDAAAGRQAIQALLRGDEKDWPAVRAILPYVRAWAVTSLSARRLPDDAGLFDLVVIDEASQCAIPHMIPLLYRAKRALVIGDPMQLTHIAELQPAEEGKARQEADLGADWLEARRLSYRRHSAFHAAEQAAGGSMLLDEHYRCHPDIAKVSNELFYGGDLRILTDVRARISIPHRGAVHWTRTEGDALRGPKGSWRNDAEVRRVKEIVEYVLNSLPPSVTVGVVTPFKGQQEALAAALRGLSGPPDQSDRLRIGTVHTFQGGERDIMVLSLVASDGMQTGAVGWLTRELNLWNVAITRARNHLIVVGNPDFWQFRGGVPRRLLLAADQASPDTRTPDPLQQRLFEQLTDLPGAKVELGTSRNGHPADAQIVLGDRTTTVLLDRAAPADDDGFRHLHRVLRQTELLADDGVGPSVRWPAWRLFDDDPGVLRATFGG